MLLVRRVLAEEGAKPVADREFNVYADAARTVGELIGDTATAADWLVEAITEAMAAGLRPARFMFLDQVRLRLVTAPDPVFDEVVEDYTEQARQAAVARAPVAVRLRVPYFPASDFAEAQRTKLLNEGFEGGHEDHRRQVEGALRGFIGRGGARPGVALLEVPGLLDFAEQSGLDPALRETWQAYAEGDEAILMAWPPARNEDCWCGSARKYKKCCGAPGFVPSAGPELVG
jgi:hypothetical protein